jgi:hypothetical protein
LCSITQLHTCWRAQEQEYAKAIIGDHANIRDGVFHGLCTKEPGGGEKKKSNFMMGLNCWKNPINMCEAFIEFKQTIIQALQVL